MAARATGRDYSLLGKETEHAVASGLASAEWYRSLVPRRQLKELMQRRDGPALRDTAIWLGALVLSGVAAWFAWGTWWAVPAFAVYGVLYGSTTDSRWHECGHGTAFRTRWLNDAVYHLACFMILREPTVWRWSHTRHHTDTIIVGRDPEIIVPRPPDIFGLLLNVFALKSGVQAFARLLRHAAGRMSAEEADFIPETERPKVFFVARIWVVLFAAVIAWAVAIGSILPLMFVGLPTFYGAWLQLLFGLTQHTGLAEDVLDHRLNSRTIYMNPLFRFLYWNMNYHIEHHMFPMVPYHALPKLHEAIKADTPPPYPGIFAAYREIVPTVLRQLREPGYSVVRTLPAGARAAAE